MGSNGALLNKSTTITLKSSLTYFYCAKKIIGSHLIWPQAILVPTEWPLSWQGAPAFTVLLAKQGRKKNCGCYSNLVLPSWFSWSDSWPVVYSTGSPPMKANGTSVNRKGPLHDRRASAISGGFSSKRNSMSRPAKYYLYSAVSPSDLSLFK